MIPRPIFLAWDETSNPVVWQVCQARTWAVLSEHATLADAEIEAARLLRERLQ